MVRFTPYLEHVGFWGTVLAVAAYGVLVAAALLIGLTVGVMTAGAAY
jgi:hypothetical protein